LNSPNQTAAQQLWLRARKDRKTARLLEQALLHPTLSRILLLHREELFPRLVARVENGPAFFFGSSAFVLTSDDVDGVARSIKKLDKKSSAYSCQIARRENTADAVRNLDEVTRQTLIDNIPLEILRVVQRNPALCALVTQSEAILYADLKRAVGDYSQLKLDGFNTALLNLFQRVLSGNRSKEVLHQLALEVDTFKDFLDVDRFRVFLLEASLSHYRQLVRTLRIRERLWKKAILDLHFDCLLEHSGPLYLWCIRCPESGVLASVRSTQLLKPFRCPRCGGKAWSATTLFPSGSLNVALRLRDGMLGAAIGWQFCKRRVPFQHSVNVGGTELDFLVDRSDDKVLIECKMNHQLKGNEQMLSALRGNLQQLDAHVRAAQAQGIAISLAVCVVNHSRNRLAQLQRSIGPSSTSTVPTRLLSYQDLRSWMGKVFIGHN